MSKVWFEAEKKQWQRANEKKEEEKSMQGKTCEVSHVNNQQTISSTSPASRRRCHTRPPPWVVPVRCSALLLNSSAACHTPKQTWRVSITCGSEPEQSPGTVAGERVKLKDFFFCVLKARDLIMGWWVLQTIDMQRRVLSDNYAVLKLATHKCVSQMYFNGCEQRRRDGLCWQPWAGGLLFCEHHYFSGFEGACGALHFF